MKKLLLGFSLFCGALFAQNTRLAPDCVIPFSFTGGGQTTANSTCGSALSSPNAGAINWTLVYYTDGFSAISLVVQSAPDANGSPGTWITFNGTVVTGANPSTVRPESFVQLTGFNPWVRVNLATVSGTGTVKGNLYGWIAGPGSAAAGGGGGGGSNECATSSTPCYVIQPTASLLNNTAVETGFNGATQTKILYCPNQAVITVSATSGPVQVIAASGSTSIYVCNAEFSAGTASNFTWDYGTGTNCGTGDTALTGAFQNVLTYSGSMSPFNPLVVPSGKALCINPVTSTTIGGVVWYAQF